MYIQWGEINIRTYENLLFFIFHIFHLNKIFTYIYCIRICSTNTCITIDFTEINAIYSFSSMKK